MCAFKEKIILVQFLFFIDLPDGKLTCICWSWLLYL